MFSAILLLCTISFTHLAASDSYNGKSVLENEILLKEEQSKIEEIKYIDREIENKRLMRMDASNVANNIQNKDNLNLNISKNKEIKINSDFTVTGGITTNKIYAEFAKILGEAQIARQLKANVITTTKLNTQSIVTERIFSKTGVVTIEADLIINNDIMAETVSMRGTSFILEGVRQWGLVHHDDFESESSLNGWSDKRTSRCPNSKNTFLGGHCNFSYNEVTKVFKNLPAHEKIKVNAAFHMLDSWDGEFAYMKIDDEKVWTKSGQHSKDKGINICGGDFNDPAFNIPIDVSVPHRNSEVKITFGSTLDEEPCNESFGIDDVMIYVR